MQLVKTALILYAAVLFAIPLSQEEEVFKLNISRSDLIESQNYFYNPKVERNLSKTEVRTLIMNVMKQFNASIRGSERYKLAEFIIDESKVYDFDPLLVTSLIAVESSFNHKATSYVGAQGLMQLMPFVANDLAQQMNIDFSDETTLYNPYMNISIGLFFLKTLSELYKDNELYYLAAYNFGPTKIRSLISSGMKVPSAYAKKVLNHYNDIKTLEI
ncbi:MAG: lytic transglycosylase domain-containing protein [Pseudomonadota bacterium]